MNTQGTLCFRETMYQKSFYNCVYAMLATDSCPRIKISTGPGFEGTVALEFVARKRGPRCPLSSIFSVPCTRVPNETLDRELSTNYQNNHPSSTRISMDTVASRTRIIFEIIEELSPWHVTRISIRGDNERVTTFHARFKWNTTGVYRRCWRNYSNNSNRLTKVFWYPRP